MIDCGFCDRPADDAMRTIKIDGEDVPVHAFHVERRPPHQFKANPDNPERCEVCSRKMEGHAA